jgi:hypothetical protein
VSHVKRAASIVKKNLSQMILELLEGRTTILQLARKWNFPPYLLTRNILDAITTISASKGAGRTTLSDVIRDPLQYLPNENIYLPEYRKVRSDIALFMANQVQDAVRADPMYGLQSDKERHLVGVEYEVVLEHQLKKLSKFVSNPFSMCRISTRDMNISSSCVSTANLVEQRYPLRRKHSFEIVAPPKLPTYC